MLELGFLGFRISVIVLLKLPNETNRKDITFLFMAFLIITSLVKGSAIGKVSSNIFNLNAA